MLGSLGQSSTLAGGAVVVLARTVGRAGGTVDANTRVNTREEPVDANTRFNTREEPYTRIRGLIRGRNRIREYAG